MRILSCLIIILAAAGAAYPQSPHGSNLRLDCSDCHVSTNWEKIPDRIKFDHNTQTSFMLTGQHATVDCKSCHKSLIFSQAKTSCNSCHNDIHRNSLGPDCARCHTPKTWIINDVIQIHQNGRFPLVGAHLSADCSSCHSEYGNLYFPPLNTSCFSCHAKQYYATTSPNHVQSNISTDCRSCHSMTSFAWTAQNFDHSFFPLIGGHKIQNCFSCHTQGSNFGGLSPDCYSCHKQDFISAKNPDHVQAKFSTRCTDCHNIMSFIPSTFNHSSTGFILTGAHTSVSCSSCHTSGYTNTPADCYSCHSKDFAATTDPNHVAQGFPHDCSQCHSTSSWGDASFDHNTTGFPLTGAHASVACSSCHTSGYTNTPTDCYSCHSQTYAAATSPANHAAAGLPHTCQDCHNTSSWTASSFNHATTGFTLTGAHVSLDCSSCHKGTVTGLTTDCYSCHSKDFNSTTDPNHVAQGFPHDCSQCHSTSSWDVATFDHNTSGFPLTGAHASVACASCHAAGYTNTPADCYSCHSKDFAATTDPNHVTQGFPHDCTQCHSTVNWSSATFDHSTTGFALTGAHISVTCASCHTSGYTNTSPACYSCHQSNYQAASNPSHTALALSTDCSSCHTTDPGWPNAKFPIHSNYYVITGAHSALTCDNCHNGNYNTAPATCYGCHTNDYNNTSNPPHKSAGYPTDCTQCHTQTAWTPSTFNHTTYFPLTGSHNVSCATCHITISNFAVFSCTASCHSQSSTDPHHSGVRNYVYSPTSCYGCHPTGGGD